MSAISLFESPFRIRRQISFSAWVSFQSLSCSSIFSDSPLLKALVSFFHFSKSVWTRVKSRLNFSTSFFDMKSCNQIVIIHTKQRRIIPASTSTWESVEQWERSSITSPMRRAITMKKIPLNVSLSFLSRDDKFVPIYSSNYLILLGLGHLSCGLKCF